VKTKQHRIIITAALVAALAISESQAKTADEKVKAPAKSVASKPVSKQAVKAPNKSSTTNTPKAKKTVAQKPAIANPKTNPAVRPDVKSAATKPAPKVTAVSKQSVSSKPKPSAKESTKTNVADKVPKKTAPLKTAEPVTNATKSTETVAAQPQPVVPFLIETPAKPEPIYLINQRFAQVPVKYCPSVSNGYGFEIGYPADMTTAPTVRKVYGNAYTAGLKTEAHVRTLNNQPIRTQAEFNQIVYQGKARQVSNLLPKIQLGVEHNGQLKILSIKKADYCLSNLTVESERNILRMDFSTKGTGYSTKADARVYVDPSFLDSLKESDLLTLSAVAAGEQYRQGLRVKRGKKGLFIGQVFGTIVTLFTGVPVTDLTASGASAVGMADRNEGALRPAVTYGYYLGVAPAVMRASLEKLASYREGYKVQGKRYDWPIPDDLSQFDIAQAELKKLIDSNAEDLMLEPKQPSETKKEVVEPTIVTPPANETGEGVGNY